MSWFTSHIVDPVADLLGDVEHGISQVTHGKVRGWLGDVEHGLSQVAHNRGLRTAATDASILAAAYLAPEFLGSAGGGTAAADTAGTTAADSLGGQAAMDASTSGASAMDLGGQAAFDASMSFDQPMLDPSTLFAASGGANPSVYTGGAIPGLDTVPTPVAMGTEVGDEAQTGVTDLIGQQQGTSWGSQLLDYLKTPRGVLTALGLGTSLYSILNKPKLPGAAQTALNAAGPAAQRAQATIASGGMGTPLWNTQKQAIDAQIDQQIADVTRNVQQAAQNQGMGGSNSAAVQGMIAEATARLNEQRQSMYEQALQQNVTNAVSELNGANQTLTSIAQMQLEEDVYAQQLAANIAGTTAKLAPLLPGG